MNQPTFARTASAAGKDRTSKWDLIAAIAEDATEAGLPVTGAQSQLLAKQALDAANDEYADGTVKDLCIVAKFDHESTPVQRQCWRTYGWSSVMVVAKAGWSQERALATMNARHIAVAELRRLVRGVNTPTGDDIPPPSFDERCAAWVQRMNTVMMAGAKLADEAESTPGLIIGSQAEMALNIYRRLSERQMDAEIRAFFEAEGVAP